VRLEHDGGMFDEHRRQPAYVFREDGHSSSRARRALPAAVHRGSGRARMLRFTNGAEARSFHRGMWGSAPHVPRPGYTREPTQP
jgi:hypothetical protein